MNGIALNSLFEGLEVDTIVSISMDAMYGPFQAIIPRQF